MISLTSPVETRAHGWPAGLKLAALALSTLGLFALRDPFVLTAILAAITVLYALPGRIFLIAGLRRLWVLWPFVALIFLWHLWLGEVASGVAIVTRMLAAVALANLVTMTTRLSDMMGVVRTLAAPLRWIGIRTQAIEVGMALVVRFTPVLAAKGQALVMSWRARAARRPGWRIVLPFAVAALDDAEQVADALKARGGL